MTTTQALKLAVEPVMRLRAVLASVRANPHLGPVLEKNVMASILISEGSELLAEAFRNSVISEDDISDLCDVVVRACQSASCSSTHLLCSVNAIYDQMAGLIERCVIDDYDHFAQSYNKKPSYSYRHFYEYWTDILLNFLENAGIVYPGVGIRSVDIGTGVGYPSLLLASLYPSMSVIATDISMAQLQQAKYYRDSGEWGTDPYAVTGHMNLVRARRGRGVSACDNLILLRSSTVPLVDNSVDLCTMASAVASYSPRLPDLLSDIRRVLRPGGRALVSFSYLSLPRLLLLIKTEGWTKATKYWQRGYYIATSPQKPVPGSERVTVNYKLSLRKPFIAQMLQDAGLEIIQAHSIFPAIYLWLAITSGVRRGDLLPPAYTALGLPLRFSQKVTYWLISRLDGYLANFPVLGYELLYEVRKSATGPRTTAV